MIRLAAFSGSVFLVFQGSPSWNALFAIDEITKISLKASFKFAHSRFSVIFCSDFSISAQSAVSI